MSKFKDLTNKVFGRLVVIEKTEMRSFGSIIWLCRCTCGNTVEINGASLKSGRTRSCGCLHKEIMSQLVHPSFENLTGRKFGQLVVTQFAYRNKKHYYYTCLCTCGNIKTVRSDNLLNGSTKSCGCGMQKTQKQSIDYTGKRINNWLVLERTSLQHSDGCYYWLCKCLTCGNIFNKIPCSLKDKETFQCQRCFLNSKTSKCAEALFDKIEHYLTYTLKREYSVENKFFDGYIPELNLLIESDGDFWHSFPHAKANDKYKKQLASKYGYKLFRVKNNSEADVGVAFQKFKQYIKRII